MREKVTEKAAEEAKELTIEVLWLKECSEAGLRELCETSSDLRFEKIQAQKTEKGKRQAIGAGFLLSRISGEITGQRQLQPNACLQEKTGVHGKPYFEDAAWLQYNLSHTDACVVLAHGTVPCGIDIEKIRKAPARVAERFFTPAERENPDCSDRRFFTLWTAKEAVLKQIGTGLAISPEQIEILPDPAARTDETGQMIWQSDDGKTFLSIAAALSCNYQGKKFHIKTYLFEKNCEQYLISLSSGHESSLQSAKRLEEVCGNLSFMPEVYIIKLEVM